MAIGSAHRLACITLSLDLGNTLEALAASYRAQGKTDLAELAQKSANQQLDNYYLKSGADNKGKAMNKARTKSGSKDQNHIDDCRASEQEEEELSARESITSLAATHGENSTQLATRLHRLIRALATQGKSAEATKVRARLLRIIDNNYA